MRSKKTIINIISSLGLQVVTVICGFIVPRLIIGNFGSSVNGLISFITQFLGYITLLDAGFTSVVMATLYKPIANKEKGKIEDILKAAEKFFRKIAYILLIYIAILCIVLPNMVSGEFDKTYTLSLIIIISISTFAEFYFGMTYRLYLQAEQKTYITSLIQMGTLVLNTIIIVILIKIGASIQFVKLFSACVFILRPILQNIYVKKKYNIKLKNATGNYKIKQKWDGLAQHIASVVHNNTDIVILTIFSNTIEVSVYSVYLMVVTGVKNLIQALTGGIEAAFGDMLAKNEIDNLNNSFKVYEGIFFAVSTIIGIVTFFTILPFVSVYTSGVMDANYIRPAFSYLIVLAEFMWIVRLPYSGLIRAAGHFKETRVGAWVEAGVNIIISIILVWKFQIIGVAIGTLIAMLIRTIEFMYHTSKHILGRSVLYTYKRLFVIAIEFCIVALIVNAIPSINIHNYLTWAIQALITTFISIIVVVTINCLVYKENISGIRDRIKNVFKSKQRG